MAFVFARCWACDRLIGPEQPRVCIDRFAPSPIYVHRQCWGQWRDELRARVLADVERGELEGRPLDVFSLEGFDREALQGAHRAGLTTAIGCRFHRLTARGRRWLWERRTLAGRCPAGGA